MLREDRKFEIHSWGKSLISPEDGALSSSTDFSVKGAA